MAHPPTQAQIDAAVARAADTVRRLAPDPGYVFALPFTPEQAAGSRQPDGRCDVGTVVDVPGGRSYVVWWHPARPRSGFGVGPPALARR